MSERPVVLGWIGAHESDEKAVVFMLEYRCPRCKEKLVRVKFSYRWWCRSCGYMVEWLKFRDAE